MCCAVLEDLILNDSMACGKRFDCLRIWLLQIVRKMLQEAGTIFSWESEETEEGRLAQITKMELNDVNLFLRTIQWVA